MAHWRVFPPAGVARDEIKKASRFGQAIKEAFDTGDILHKEPILRGLGAVKVDENTIVQEYLGHLDFTFWAKLIHSVSKPGSWRRVPLILLFGLQLLLLLIATAPILILYRFTLAPFMREKMKKRIAYYEQPSGSSDTKMENSTKRVT